MLYTKMLSGAKVYEFLRKANPGCVKWIANVVFYSFLSDMLNLIFREGIFSGDSRKQRAEIDKKS
jgi:hypothetical protein